MRWSILLEMRNFCMIWIICNRAQTMKTFSFSDLSRKSGDVLDAALAGPVSLMKRGKTKVVMLPVDEYQKLVDGSGVRQAFSIDTASDEDIAILLNGFQNIVDDAEAKHE
jgi:prevent-host-death family protein